MMLIEAYSITNKKFFQPSSYSNDFVRIQTSEHEVFWTKTCVVLNKNYNEYDWWQFLFFCEIKFDFR